MTPTIKQSLADIVLQRWPWLAGVVTVAGSKGKGLAIRAASGLIHLMGGPDDPGVVRVGDAGTAGGFTAAGPSLTYVGPDGTSWTITALANTGTGVVAWTIVPVTGTGGALVTESLEGSERVTCG